MVASMRSSSMSIFIKGSRLTTAATEVFGSLSVSMTALLMARRKPLTAFGFSFTNFFEKISALE